MHYRLAMHAFPPYCVSRVTYIACPRFMVVPSLRCFSSFPTVVRVVVLDWSTYMFSFWPSRCTIVVSAHS